MHGASQHARKSARSLWRHSDNGRRTVCHGDARNLQPRALALRVAAIRKPEVNQNATDYPIGSPGWPEVDEDFARDVRWTPSGDLDILNHDLTGQVEARSESFTSANRNAALVGYPSRPFDPKVPRWLMLPIPHRLKICPQPAPGLASKDGLVTFITRWIVDQRVPAHRLRSQSVTR